MILNKKVFFKVLVICLVFISFFLGYFLRENSAGGGLEFYKLSWPIIQSFQKDFLFTINNYGTFGDYTIPFSHIINAYLNPFSNNVSNFQLSVLVISFVVFFIFALVLKKIFSDINFIDILLTSSVILLLPFLGHQLFGEKMKIMVGYFLFWLFISFLKSRKVYIGFQTKKIYSILHFSV